MDVMVIQGAVQLDFESTLYTGSLDHCPPADVKQACHAHADSADTCSLHSKCHGGKAKDWVSSSSHLAQLNNPFPEMPTGSYCKA